MLSQANQWGLVSVSRSMSCCDLSHSTQGLGSTGKGGTSPKGERKPEAFPKPGPTEALYGERIGLRQLRWKWGGMCVGGSFKIMYMCHQEKLTPPGSPEEALSGSDLWFIFNPAIGLHTAFTPQSEQLWKAAGCAGRT